jgi:hypothetical protein
MHRQRSCVHGCRQGEPRRRWTSACPRSNIRLIGRIRLSAGFLTCDVPRRVTLLRALRRGVGPVQMVLRQKPLHVSLTHMTDEISASFTSQWSRLRLHAIATLFDVGFYLVLWIGVLCIYLMRLAAIYIGFDSEVVSIVRWMEAVANIIFFGSFFARLVIRALRGVVA